jgi:hypothetical protein
MLGCASPRSSSDTGRGPPLTGRASERGEAKGYSLAGDGDAHGIGSQGGGVPSYTMPSTLIVE